MSASMALKTGDSFDPRGSSAKDIVIDLATTREQYYARRIADESVVGPVSWKDEAEIHVALLRAVAGQLPSTFIRAVPLDAAQLQSASSAHAREVVLAGDRRNEVFKAGVDALVSFVRGDEAAVEKAAVVATGYARLPFGDPDEVEHPVAPVAVNVNPAASVLNQAVFNLRGQESNLGRGYAVGEEPEDIRRLGQAARLLQVTIGEIGARQPTVSDVVTVQGLALAAAGRLALDEPEDSAAWKEAVESLVAGV